MRMTAKEFAQTNNIPLCTVKRYCKQGIFRCHRIGRKYSIDVNYALKALDDLDEQEQALNIPIKPAQHKRKRSSGVFDFEAALKAEMRRIS